MTLSFQRTAQLSTAPDKGESEAEGKRINFHNNNLHDLVSRILFSLERILLTEISFFRFYVSSSEKRAQNSGDDEEKNNNSDRRSKPREPFFGAAASASARDQG